MRTRDGAVHLNPALPELPQMLETGKADVWINLNQPSAREMAQAFERIFPIHPLAAEDVRQFEGTPKLDNYGSYLVVVFHSVVQSPESAFEVATAEHTAILGRQVLLTVTNQGHPPCFTHAHAPRHHRDAGLRNGPSRLLYELMDRQVDASRHVLENFEAVIESLGDVIFTRDLSMGSEHQIMEDLLTAKTTALRLHRILKPQATVLARLGDEKFAVIPAEARIFFQDAHDQAVHLAHMSESLKDLATSTMTTHLTLANHRLNEVMKVLTMIATVFIPLTFITSVYGMNFSTMPELSWRWSYPAIMGGCALLVAVMLLWFRRKRWF